MRPLVKRKSKSLPFIRSQIYKKINSNFGREMWRLFMQKEMDLQWATKQLSKADFDISNQNHNKFSVRQNFQLKKQIIRCLESKLISKSIELLQQLSTQMKLVGQQKRSNLMIVYLECRQIVLSQLTTGNQQYVISEMKSKISKYLADFQPLLAKIKALSILSILLLRYHGILMTPQERNILIKTIELKKKKMLHLDSKEQRQAQFQCLLYLLLQLYKILFLLKKDQQMIIQFYNQLFAYTQIYQEHQQKKLFLNISQIIKILNDMKPVMIDLDIYQDTKIKKALAFEHIKKEIIQYDQRQSIDFRITSSSLKTSGKIKLESSQNLDSSKKLKLIRGKEDRKFTLKRPLKISYTSTHPNPIPQENDLDVMNQLSTKGILFQCSLPINQKIYFIETHIAFRNGYGVIDLDITLKTESLSIEKYKIKGLQMGIDTLSLQKISKFIQKLYIKLFGYQGQFRQLHNLITLPHQGPHQYSQMLVSLIRSKTIIKQYFRRNYNKESIINKKIVHPTFKIAEIKQLLQCESKQKDSLNFRCLAIKRTGILYKDSKPPILDNTIFIKFIVRRQLDFSAQYFIFNAHFAECFKGLDIFCFEEEADPSDITGFIKKLKQISRQTFEKHKLISIKKSIGQLLQLQNKIQRIKIPIKNYKIEQQWQLNHQKINYQTAPLKYHQKSKKTKTEKIKNIKTEKQFQVIKIRQNQYAIFVKQINNGFVKYTNEKTNIQISQNFINCNFKLVKTRTRMYNSIKVFHDIGTRTVKLKTSKRKNSDIDSEEQMVITFLKHFILRKIKGYYIILEYQCPNNNFLYEMILDKANRYYTLSKLRLNINEKEVNLLEMKIMNLTCQKFTSNKKQTSQANHYYLSIIQNQ